jgi:hypothetical protein
LAERREVIEGVLKAVAVAGLEFDAFLAAGGEFLVPLGEPAVVFGAGGAGAGDRPGRDGGGGGGRWRGCRRRGRHAGR